MINKEPEGYKKLLAYKKSDELQNEVLKLAELIMSVKGSMGEMKTMHDLADQMVRSARSGKQNIVEGWKRNTTKEYFDFLGFSIASVEELKEDAADIIQGKYKRLTGERGIMGERGMSLIEASRLPFYPLDALLPLIVQVYLKCKELNMLLNKLKKSLDQKMQSEGSLPAKEKLRNREQQKKEEDAWLQEQLKGIHDH